MGELSNTFHQSNINLTILIYETLEFEYCYGSTIDTASERNKL